MIHYRTLFAAAVIGGQAVCATSALAYAPQEYGAAAEVPWVWRSQDVVNAIGICTHVGYSNSVYANTAGVIAALKYVGVTSVRDSIPVLPPNDPREAPYDAVMGAGFKMSMVTPEGAPPSGYSTMTAAIKASLDREEQKFPGKILSVEGINEPDLTLNDGYTYQYNGLSGPAAVAQNQIDLYTLMKADPLLSSIPVVEFSLNSAPYNQMMYHAVYAANPAVTKAFDVASRGVYAGVWSPQFQMQQQIVDPFDIGWVNNNYVYGAYEPKTEGRPEEVKETGLTSSPTGIPALGVSDYTVQAKMLPYTVLDTLKLGSQRTFMYELADIYPDPSGTVVDDHFGLFDNNLNPKPAATVMHNLMAKLSDTSSTATTFTPSQLNVTIRQFPMASPGAVPSGLSLVTQKANGNYQILVWYEPLLWNQTTNTEMPVPAATPITLYLNKTCVSTSVYDPLTNTTVAGPSKSSQIPVSLPDHAVIASCNVS